MSGFRHGSANVTSARSLALDVVDRLRGFREVTVGRFFGGAGLMIDGVQVGFVMKASLYLRVDDVSRARYESLGASPFHYARAERTVTVARYYRAPDEIVDDPEQLSDWIADAHRAAIADGGARRRVQRISRSQKERCA